MTHPPHGREPGSGLCLSRRRELHGHPGWPGSHADTCLLSGLPCFVWGSRCSRATVGSRVGAQGPCTSRPGVGTLRLRCRSPVHRIWASLCPEGAVRSVFRGGPLLASAGQRTAAGRQLFMACRLASAGGAPVGNTLGPRAGSRPWARVPPARPAASRQARLRVLLLAEGPVTISLVTVGVRSSFSPRCLLSTF